MTPESTASRISDDRQMARTFGRAVQWACLLWLAVMGLAWLMSQTGAGERWLADVRSGDVIVVAIASLLISLAAMIPGWAMKRSTGVQPHANSDQSTTVARRQTTRLVASVLIRVCGTVALFLACRYQMATPIEKLAAMVLGWYVLLTFVEILVLARGLSRPVSANIDRSAF
jgi:hypothetical protein